MKNFIFSTIFLFLSVLICFAQKTRPPIKPAKSEVVQAVAIKEISNTEWKNLADALTAENWNKSALLAAQYLQKIKVDNEKKQLAQLRYFYLYSLAGEILALSSANKISEADVAWQELDKAVSEFTGK